LIKRSRYNDDGYVIRWWRALIPSNSLAAVYGIAADCAERQVLGPDVAIDIELDRAAWASNTIFINLRRSTGRRAKARDREPYFEGRLRRRLGTTLLSGELANAGPPEVLAPGSPFIPFSFSLSFWKRGWSAGRRQRVP